MTGMISRLSVHAFCLKISVTVEREVLGVAGDEVEIPCSFTLDPPSKFLAFHFVHNLSFCPQGRLSITVNNAVTTCHIVSTKQRKATSHQREATSEIVKITWNLGFMVFNGGSWGTPLENKLKIRILEWWTFVHVWFEKWFHYPPPQRHELFCDPPHDKVQSLPPIKNDYPHQLEIYMTYKILQYHILIYMRLQNTIFACTILSWCFETGCFSLVADRWLLLILVTSGSSLVTFHSFLVAPCSSLLTISHVVTGISYLYDCV